VVARRSGLGRGLGSLIPGGDTIMVDVTTPVTSPQGDAVDLRESGPLREVSIRKVVANTYQPRKTIDKAALAPLADSIKELGVLQPILVREKGDGNYELIAGERRWRAAQLAGLTSIPVIVRDADDSGSLEQAIVENLHRKDLNAIDEASAYRQMIDDFGMTHEQVGQRTGKSRTAVSNLLRLLQLPPKVQKHLIDEKLSEGHARALLGTDDEAFQQQLADRAAKEAMSVRSVEEAVRMRNELAEPLTKKRKTGKTGSAVSTSAGALEWQSRLADRLDTRVSVSAGKRGKITIEFADPEDLERIASLIESGKNADIGG
jgi:ParB family transcriptional regulator, chromosome partitioning protein